MLLKNSSIYLRAALLFLVFSACAVQVFYLPYRIMRNATLEGFRRQEILLARRAAGEIEDFFRHYQDELAVVARENNILSPDPQERLCLDRYQQRHRSEVAAVVVTDPTGKISYSTGETDLAEIARWPGFLYSVLQAGQARVSDVFTLQNGENVVACTVPLDRDGMFAGDLSILVSLRSLTDRFLAGLRPAGQGYTWMISHEGTELYSPFAADVGKPFGKLFSGHPEILAMAEEMRAGRQGHAVFADDVLFRRQGQPVRQLAVYTPIRLPGNTWSIAVAAPESEALAAVSSFQKWWAGLFVLLFIAFLVYTVFLVRMKLRQQEDRRHRELDKKALENERFLSRFINSTTIPIGIARIDGTVELLNASAVRMYGYTLEDIPTLDDWFRKAYPDDTQRAHVRTVWQERLQETMKSGISYPAAEWTITCRDGSQRDVVFTYTLIDDRIIYTINDVTEENILRRKELQLQEQRARARKMETIGLMAGGVAHDLNNILSGIISYPELMLMRLPEDSDLRAPLLAIKDSGERAAAVVADLLTVARGVASSKEPTNLNELVRSYLDSPEFHQLKNSCTNLQCQTRLDEQLENISCSPVHIRKCLMNLVTNAVEAVEGNGTIIISTGNEVLRESDGEREAGRYVTLSVTDSGPGIDEEDLEHIFEPFYSRKVLGKSGTGLGLTVVWNTVIEHGGTVRVRSSARGTVFELSFPTTSDTATDQKNEEDIAALSGSGELILVVDDEQQQRDICHRILELLGYQVETVSSGEEAVAFLRQQPVELLVLDMVLGTGLNGLQTYEQILHVRPGQKAVIASGYAENDDVARTLSMGAFGYIKKPYSIAELGRMVKEALRAE